MTVQICIETKLDLSKSPLNKKDKLDFLAKEVHVNGVGVFDDNGRFYLLFLNIYLTNQSMKNLRPSPYPLTAKI